MKILCVCRAGIVRSGALSMNLKQRFGYLDTLQAGVDFNSPETLSMLYAWADKIYIVEDVFWNNIPEEFKAKTELINIGPDVWGNCMNPELQSKVINLLTEKKI